jgi:hypothetical protein
MTGGLGVAVAGVSSESGVPALLGLVLLGLFLCFAAYLLVDHGFSLRAFCMTKERAFRRPWRDALACVESTKRKSCGIVMVSYTRRLPWRLPYNPPSFTPNQDKGAAVVGSYARED